MSRRLRICVALLATTSIVLFGIFVKWVGPHEPVHEGMGLMEWVRRHEQSPNQLDAATIRTMGRDALPWLLSELRCKDLWFVSSAGSMLNEYLHLNIAPKLAEQRHYEAVTALRLIGPENKKAVPTLIRLTKDPERDIRFFAIEALAAIGPAAATAMPALSECLEDPDPDVVQGAFNALTSMDKEGLPALIAGLKHTNGVIRVTAADRIQSLGPGAQPALDQLIRTMKNSEEETRVHSIRALAAVGPKAAAAVPALKLSLEDRSLLVRRTAIETLGKIGPAAEPAIPAIIRESEDINLNAIAVIALRQMGPAGQAEASKLDIRRKIRSAIAALSDSSENRRIFAARALGEMGLLAQPAFAALTNALKDEKEKVRFFAACAIAAVQPESKEPVQILIKGLGNPTSLERSSYRKIAAATLWALGPTASEAAPALRLATEDPDAEFAAFAREALNSVDQQKHD